MPFPKLIQGFWKSGFVSWCEKRFQIVKRCHIRVFSVPRDLVLRELQTLSSQNQFHCLLRHLCFLKGFLHSILQSTLFPCSLWDVLFIDASTPRISVLKHALPYQCPVSTQFLSESPHAQLCRGLLKSPKTPTRSWLLATCKYFMTAVSRVLLTASAHWGYIQMATLLIKARNKTGFIYSFLDSTAFIFQWNNCEMLMKKIELFMHDSGTLG